MKGNSYSSTGKKININWLQELEQLWNADCTLLAGGILKGLISHQEKKASDSRSTIKVLLSDCCNFSGKRSSHQTKYETFWRYRHIESRTCSCLSSHPSVRKIAGPLQGLTSPCWKNHEIALKAHLSGQKEGKRRTETN
ncbi:Uncharacterized protein Adt_00344 [Abeliophyllum distichum]|uniref:Uncharacterized protein n=1 Tax=Abeliophyllum distichum TaxID=126358 RepID=A0ABD1VPT7_9LAMI